ncbi:hypothetical protein BC835DRAFT_1410783 [Cytidiella melzeri]|nr:hypothetical protein BC835DRAFT_1410783 [Cytidiella melzeri]
MSRKRKSRQIQLYDHSAQRNRATASTIDVDHANRRLKVQKQVVMNIPKVDTPPPDLQDPTHDYPADDTQQITEQDVGLVVIATTCSKRYMNLDTPLLMWLDYRWSYLQELYCGKGRGTVAKHSGCPKCGGDRAVYRCQECFGGALLCRRCCLDGHWQLPLHRIQEWVGDFFRKVSLKTLGLVVQLGNHTAQSKCVLPNCKRLVVLHTNGVHEVTVNFCGCCNDVETYQQLLRALWYPVTPLQPESCTTFELMDLFHILNLQGNLTVYNFFKSLEILTDGWQLEGVPQVFTTIVREWRNLSMLMRAGRGYKPDGIAKTERGELAVQCRACPHPGVNLPEDFATAPEHLRYLYWQTIAMDCNFHLKNRYQATQNVDEVHKLGRDEYLCRIPSYAIGKPEAGKGSQGDRRLRRKCNVDYVLLAALLGSSLYLLIMYDIVCQYFKMFWTRMLGLPQAMHLNILSMTHIVVKIPKGHIRTHEDSCQGPFSLNYTDGAAETNGEGIERLWSWLNKSGAQCKINDSSSTSQTPGQLLWIHKLEENLRSWRHSISSASGGPETSNNPSLRVRSF